MGYFKDTFDIMLLKDKAYKKVGNDKKAFKKFFRAYLLSFYLIEFIIGILIFSGITIIIPQMDFNLQLHHILTILPIFLIFPLIILVIELLFNLIPYLIGLAVGVRPKNFIDFFKVSNYPNPIITPLTIFARVLLPIYSIWSFFILYKTYRIIHRLNSRRAAWAIGINIFLLLILCFICLLPIFYVIAQDPALMAESGEPISTAYLIMTSSARALSTPL